MGIPVLILGESGSGKSTSLRNFEQEEIGIFNVASKPLPFRKKLPTRNGATYASITKALSHPKGRTYCTGLLQSTAIHHSEDAVRLHRLLPPPHRNQRYGKNQG